MSSDVDDILSYCTRLLLECNPMSLILDSSLFFLAWLVRRAAIFTLVGVEPND